MPFVQIQPFFRSLFSPCHISSRLWCLFRPLLCLARRVAQVSTHQRNWLSRFFPLGSEASTYTANPSAAGMRISTIKPPSAEFRATTLPPCN